MQPVPSNKPVKLINFAHANGFPSASYKKLFAHLPKGFKVIALDKYAHNPKYPVNDNWQNQIQEMIDFVEGNRIGKEKVVALGHSFGAVVSYMSVCLRPDLFSTLIMLDPPLITGFSRYFFRMAKYSRLIDRITPAGITKNRKMLWKKEEDLHAYFASKRLFKEFDPDCIADYIKAVIQMKGENKHLLFDVETESTIFRTIPHNLPSYKGMLMVPTTLITAKYTDVTVPALRSPFLKANPTIKHIEFEKGKHMFPLEYPIEVADLISKILFQHSA